MNLIARSVISFLTLLLLFAASTLHAVEGSPTLSRIQKSGKLVLGTSGNMPLMTEKQSTGEFTGLDIDLATAMAKSMGVKLDIKTIPFNELIPALEQGKVDIVLSNMTITPERNMRVAFAGPYFVSGKCLITKEQEMASAGDAEKLNSARTSFAVVKGSTSETFAKELLSKSKRVPVQDVDSGVDKVASGKVDAMLTDFPVCLGIMKRHKNGGFASVLSTLTYEPIGIALPANDPLFLNWMENFLNRIEGVGMLEALGLKWFGKAKLTVIDQQQ